ncbi:dynein light intermediate chain-domain-containing protein [Naematelia encephala]|uniref:Dynein light intermediate chain-domain-containing protein n=1 Tax=Naematelia encephala TaxID=71784 RepID=A0A1Y2AX43_9TREE|nr:dynein light intermediate chain-domain-containing protein [Naematelia encephala]
MDVASISTSAGPSSSERTDLWSEILRSANRGTRGRGSWKRKNILLLSERHHGRRYLLDQLLSAPSTSRSRVKPSNFNSRSGRTGSLAMGYEVLEVKEDGDEDSVPPVSIFYPPSSHPSITRLIPRSLPPDSLLDTTVMILLDWTKPSSMIKELQSWLAWTDSWARESAQKGELEELHERLQSHLQHYTEPVPSTPAAGSSTSPFSTPALPSIASAFQGGPLLPLGQGSLTLNQSGVPIIVVCTKADLMDTAGDEIGMKGGGWEERTDWVQQVLRTICLSYGASLFYTAASQPTTYTLLRSYLLHRLYTVPPPLDPSNDAPPPTASSSRFLFPHRANVLDRDAVMVPAGWDSWGKINVLRDGYDPDRVGKAWEASLRRFSGSDEADEDEGIDDLWVEMIPDTERSTKPTNQPHITTTTEPEQSFLSRQLDILLKDPNRDPRATFRNAANLTAASSSSGPGETDTQAGVVGPMGSGGLNLPGVEKAMLEMEGGSAEDLREKFARLGRRESSRAGPLSPTGTAPGGGSSTVPNEALHNFFQGLLATKGKTGSSTPKQAETKQGSSA